MKLIKFLLIFAAGMSFTYFFFNQRNSAEVSKFEWKPTFIEKADLTNFKKQVSKVLRTQNELSNERADNFTSIYNRLGLKAGDIIKKINDISVVEASQKIFPALVSAYKNGNVCVTYQRNGEERQSCLKTVTNEDVVNQPVAKE